MAWNKQKLRCPQAKTAPLTTNFNSAAENQSTDYIVVQTDISLNFAPCQVFQASRYNQIPRLMPAPTDWMNKHLLCQSGKGTELAACRLNKVV